MTEKIQIKAVDMVRRIRDEQAQMLDGKSKTELIAFFTNAGERIRQNVKKKQTTKAKPIGNG